MLLRNILQIFIQAGSFDTTHSLAIRQLQANNNSNETSSATNNSFCATTTLQPGARDNNAYNVVLGVLGILSAEAVCIMLAYLIRSIKYKNKQNKKVIDHTRSRKDMLSSEQMNEHPISMVNDQSTEAQPPRLKIMPKNNELYLHHDLSIEQMSEHPISIINNQSTEALPKRLKTIPENDESSVHNDLSISNNGKSMSLSPEKQLMPLSIFHSPKIKPFKPPSVEKTSFQAVKY